MVLSTVNPNRDILYSDLRKDMLLNPVNRDVSRFTDEASIKEALKNLLLTSKGERLFNPRFGGDLRSLLFSNIVPGSRKIIQTNIENAINNYEPRVEIIDVDVKLFPDNSAAEITILFKIINRQEPISLNIVLDRVR